MKELASAANPWRRKTLPIITGSTRSVGRTTRPLGGPAPSVVDYDCAANIRKLVDSTPFIPSVLFTWDRQSLRHGTKLFPFVDDAYPTDPGVLKISNADPF